MHVFLLRHGAAEDRAPDGGLNDEARHLSEEGREHLIMACRAYRLLIGEMPMRLFHSPLIRARQTAEIFANAATSALPSESKEILRPSGRVGAVIDLLQTEFLDGAERVVLVGHEPLLGNLLGLLSSGNERLSLPLSKGMLAQVELHEPQVMIGRLSAVISQEAAIHLARARS